MQSRIVVALYQRRVYDLGMRALALVVALVACDKTNPNCERAVSHVFSLTIKGPPGSKKPSAEEQRVIDQIVSASMKRCNDEGLSDAQRDCILAAKSLDDRAFLMCPALVTKKPTWIVAPIGHPELLDEIKQLDADP